MTKNDYILLSSAILDELQQARDSGADEAEHAIKSLTLTLAGVMKRDNPKLKQGLFLKSCGMVDEASEVGF